MKARIPALVALALALGMLYFPARLALAFELFGNAVHSPTSGLLGPLVRGLPVLTLRLTVSASGRKLPLVTG